MKMSNVKKAIRRSLGRTVFYGIKNGKWSDKVGKERLNTFGKTAMLGNEEYEFFHRYEFIRKIKKDYYWIVSYQTKSDLENGFSKPDPSSDRLIKYVSPADLDFVFEKEMTAIYRGDLFAVGAIEGKEVCLCTSDCALAKRHGMEEYDGEYHIRVKLNEVEEITQNWIPLNEYNKQISGENRKAKGHFRTLGKAAIYKNTEYEFLCGTDEDCHAIISHRVKSDTENGFSKSDPASGKLIKYVSLADLDFVFEKETTAIYKGDVFGVNWIQRNEINLSTKDRNSAEKHDCIREWDWGYYHGYARLKDVEKITQKWIPRDEYNKQIFAAAEKEAEGKY
jgi:hypothetical protein